MNQSQFVSAVVMGIRKSDIKIKEQPRFLGAGRWSAR